MEKQEKAMNYFENGCNCSQAVVMPYAIELNVEEEVIQKMAVAFGGGMSKAGKTCGCLSGALMVIGLKYGEDSAKIIENRIKSYNEGQKFIKNFDETFGATDCYKLIRLDLNKKEDMEQAQAKVFGSRCRNMVGKTVELLEKHFLDNEEI